ncbi:MAG TPA: DEAD/DEAH box helicase family protein, partial [Polyangiaceae bacterium]|nr:DEAD/DEAH box helicase family protein [Polyangiaceae bacterium]
MMLQLTFDRGTLILRGALPPQSIDKLPGLVWDPRIENRRAPAFRYREIVTQLRVLNLPFVDDVFGTIQRLNSVPIPPLRPYQHAALMSWDAAGKVGLLVLPTGSGKTRLACAALAASGVPTLCLVPTRPLLHQWRDEIARHYSGPVGCLGDGSHRTELVTVATFESAYRNMAQLGSRFELLVIDEAHHFGCGIRDEALEFCASPWRLGLTATAPEGEPLKRIHDLIGPVVCELSIGDLSGKWLAPFEVVVLTLRLTAEEQRRYDAAIATFRLEFDVYRGLTKTPRWRDFVALASRSEHGRAALAAFRYSRKLTSYPEAKRQALSELLARHRTSGVLIFTSDNETAYAIARAHLIMPITCDIDRAERSDALAAFRRGELRALVSARVLNEGVDVPDADVGIIVGGVNGEREHVQRVGRLLRPAPGKRATVYELVIARTHEVR